MAPEIRFGGSLAVVVTAFVTSLIVSMVHIGLVAPLVKDSASTTVHAHAQLSLNSTLNSTADAVARAHIALQRERKELLSTVALERSALALEREILSRDRSSFVDERKRVDADRANADAERLCADRGRAAVRRNNSARLSPFSSFECVAGSQMFEMPLQQTQRVCSGAPQANDAIMRSCVLRDVCLVGGRLMYYVDPVLEDSTPAIFRLKTLLDQKPVGMQPEMPGSVGTGFAYAGYLAGCNREGIYLPELVYGPRPATLPFREDDRMYVMGELSNAQNFGHLLMDTILPTLSVAGAYGLPTHETQYVGLTSCESMRMGQGETAQGKNSVQCQKNVERWLLPILDLPPLFPPHADGCFRRLLYGHEHQLSLANMFLHRSSAIRTARLKLHESLGVDPRVDFSARRHEIVVMQKVVLHVGEALPGLCDAVKRFSAALSPEPAVLCFKPGDKSVKEQLEIISTATLLVAEHGR